MTGLEYEVDTSAHQNDLIIRKQRRLVTHYFHWRRLSKPLCACARRTKPRLSRWRFTTLSAKKHCVAPSTLCRPLWMCSCTTRFDAVIFFLFFRRRQCVEQVTAGHHIHKALNILAELRRSSRDRALGGSSGSSSALQRAAVVPPS